VCQAQELSLRGRDISNRNRAFEETWVFGARDPALGQRRQLFLNGREFEINPQDTDWRSDLDEEWKVIAVTPLNGECTGACNCCGVRRGWYAQFDCGGSRDDTRGAVADRFDSTPATGGVTPIPDRQPDPNCPTCVPRNRLVVFVCKPNTIMVRSRNPLTGASVMATLAATQRSQLNTDIQLRNNVGAFIEVDPDTTEFKFEGGDWRPLMMMQVKGKCEGECNCCGVLLHHYARFDCD
jgi:hypothetical protein